MPPGTQPGPKNEGMNAASGLPGRRPAVGRDNYNCIPRTNSVSQGTSFSAAPDYRLAATRLKDACGAGSTARAAPGP